MHAERIDLARSRFSEGFSCSQSVLAAFAPEFGLDVDAALRVAAAFGGGMGRPGHPCGAVTGALMALGLRYGATVVDPAAKELTYAKARDFVATAFGGGMGRLGHTCGAVTGAVDGVGSSLRRDRRGPQRAKELTYAKARDFVAKFEARHGATSIAPTCSA